jgi:hypothetical protein
MYEVYYEVGYKMLVPKTRGYPADGFGGVSGGLNGIRSGTEQLSRCSNAVRPTLAPGFTHSLHIVGFPR